MARDGTTNGTYRGAKEAEEDVGGLWKFTLQPRIAKKEGSAMW
jgi:hypothetical protein